MSDKESWEADYGDGSGVPLYAIKKDGTLQQYPSVAVLKPEEMPSGGDFANPEADRPNVKGLEDKMISFFGNCLVEAQCKPENWRGEVVDLRGKMLRAEHVDALAAALAKYKVANVNLGGNQLGPEGAAKLAEALKTNTALTSLDLSNNEVSGSILARAVRSAGRVGAQRLGRLGVRKLLTRLATVSYTHLTLPTKA